MDADKKRGQYISNDGSDFLVEEILKRKETLLQHNPKGIANGASLKKKSADEVVAAFSSRYPGLNKTYDQLKKNFDKRRDTLKKSLIMERAYTSATGGGRDAKVEAEIKKLQNPSLTDSMLISYLKRTEGAMGVGDLSLETGQGFGSISGRKYSSADDLEEDVEQVDDDAPCTSKSIKKTSSVKISNAGIERAKKLSHLEFIKAGRGQMLKRAVELGFRKSEKSAPPPKKEKIEVEGMMGDAISQVVNVVERLEGRIDASSGKGLAAIEGMEQLRAAVRYGGSSLTQADLQEIIDCYDRKVRSAEMAGSEDAPIQLG